MLLPTLIFLSTYSHGPLSPMGCGAQLMGTIFMALWNNHMNLAWDLSPQDGKLSWFGVLLFEMHGRQETSFQIYKHLGRECPAEEKREKLCPLKG